MWNIYNSWVDNDHLTINHDDSPDNDNGVSNIVNRYRFDWRPQLNTIGDRPDVYHRDHRHGASRNRVNGAAFSHHAPNHPAFRYERCHHDCPVVVFSFDSAHILDSR